MALLTQNGFVVGTVSVTSLVFLALLGIVGVKARAEPTC